MSSIRAWLKASRLPSQSYIALPLIVGQLLAFRVTGQWDWTVFILVQLFGVFDQLYIVFANDYADQETDKNNQTFTMFSGGSRVLVDQSIKPQTLARAALLMAILAASVGAILLVGWGRVVSLPLMLLGLGLLWAYSYPPIRLSYRGGGELLQMIGVGAILPLIGFDAQAGGLAGFPWPILGAILPLNFATAMSTALPDEPSDRISAKRTTSVLFGTRAVRAVIIMMNLLGLGLFFITGYGAVAGLEWTIRELTGVSLLACLVALGLSRGALPGSRKVLGFVFFAVLANLAFLVALVVDLATP